MSLAKPYAVQHGHVIPESELSCTARAILEKMSRVAYVLDCHRVAVAKHSRTLAELQAELERVEQVRR